MNKGDIVDNLAVLHLEDSALDAELTLAALREAGIPCEVERVERREEFIDALARGRHDLILADYVLPDFDGVTAMRLARELRPDVPFIFVSGTLGEEFAIETLKSGATDYVLKQRLSRLVPAIERAVREVREREALRRIQHELRGSEERFRRLIEGVVDYAVFTLDLDGTVVTWNHGAQTIIGYTESQIVGRSYDCFFTAEDRNDGVPMRDLVTARESGRAAGDRWQVRSDGTLFWASGVVTPLRDGNGAIEGYSAILRDLTERRRSEIELRRAKEAAEAANKAKDQFLAILSHELRTPLTPVMGILQLLEERIDDEEGRLLLDLLERNIALETRLIDDLLDLTRITYGRMQLETRDIDIHDTIRHAVAICAEPLSSKSLQLRLQLAAEPSVVHADGVRLLQIVLNLLHNAIKFTPSGGTIYIATSVASDGRVRLDITDSGIGIDAEALERIFNPFEQGEQTTVRQYGGLGLGLAISKALADLHGAQLLVASEGIGSGSTFTLMMKHGGVRGES